jgi:ribosomal protein S18 acetylase RimI-like enzyme
VICYVDSEPAGLINCFEAFSSFQCKPLINIHDVIVSANFRGLGISQLMMKKVEEMARNRSCCKITLEVLEGNEVAKSSYKKFGFSGYELNPRMGRALFWEKSI